MRWYVVPLCIAMASFAAACGGDDNPSAEAPEAGSDVIDVSSAAFGEGEAIPVEYTCDGEELSPPLQWSGVPDDAESLALVVDDPDAPGGTFVHWVVIDIPTDQTGSDKGSAPAGGVELKSSGGGAEYAGPCPPSGTHHYRFTVYALSQSTGLGADASLDAAFEAITADAVARGQLIGVYEHH